MAARRLRIFAAALLVVLLALPAMWPFLRHAGYWASHDGLFHLYRLLSLEAAWQQGHPYPRAFPDFAFGYGFSVLHFYGPLTYLIALALSGLGLGAVGAMKATFALSYPLAALAAWWLARDLWGGEEAPNEAAGVAAAVAYTYVPYHMADVQLRGALAESWAFVWWPLLFWAAWRARPWPLALALAALILTHNLSVVLVAAPLAAWALLVLARPAPLSSLLSPPSSLLLVGAAALAATAFYWLPVALESRYVWISQDVGGLGFMRHLAPWHEWVAASPSYRYFPDQGTLGEHPLSWAQVALLAMAALALPRLWRSAWRGPALFWWATLLGAGFLLTPASAPLWRALVFPFGLVQYPWRWLGLVALATALVAGSVFARGAEGGEKREERGERREGWLMFILHPLSFILLLWLAFSSMQHLPWQPRAVDVARHPAAMWAEDVAAGQVGATWTAEFLPLSVREQRWALARAPERVPNVGERSPLTVTGAGGDGWTLWAEVEAAEAGWLLFPRFAYPSMRATVDGAARPVVARGALGLAGVEVHAGQHRVALDAMPLASWGAWQWLLALPPLALLALALARWRWRAAALGGAALLIVGLGVARGEARPFVPPDGSRPIAIGEQAQLAGFRVDGASARPGQPLRVTLLWFNRAQTDQRYSSFVHLTAPGGGPPVAQHDREPNLGTVPTPRWQPGQLVEDLHLLDLPTDLPPGSYQLWAGLYAPTPDGTAPLPGDSGERRLLGGVEIGD